MSNLWPARASPRQRTISVEASGQSSLGVAIRNFQQRD
jgi:hypothetical protein